MSTAEICGERFVASTFHDGLGGVRPASYLHCNKPPHGEDEPHGHSPGQRQCVDGCPIDHTKAPAEVDPIDPLAWDACKVLRDACTDCKRGDWCSANHLGAGKALVAAGWVPS